MGATPMVDAGTRVGTPARHGRGPRGQGNQSARGRHSYAVRANAAAALGQIVAGSYRLAIVPDRYEVRIADRGAVVRYRIELGTRTGGRQTAAFGWYERIREANGERCDTAVSAADVMAVCREVPSVDEVARAVAAEFRVPASDILCGGRWPRGAFERQVAIYVADRVAALDRRELADRFGARGHSNVEQACRRVAVDMRHRPQVGGRVERLCDELRHTVIGRSDEVARLTERACRDFERLAAEQAELAPRARAHEPCHLRVLAARLRAEVDDGRNLKRVGTRRLQAALLERIVRGDSIAVMCERGGFMTRAGTPDTSWIQRRAGLAPTRVDKHGKDRLARTAAYEHYVKLVRAIGGEFHEWGI